jgi:hypothetical protein
MTGSDPPPKDGAGYAARGRTRNNGTSESYQLSPKQWQRCNLPRCHMTRDVERERGDHRGHERKRRKRIEAPGEAPGIVLDPAHCGWTESRQGCRWS